MYVTGDRCDSRANPALSRQLRSSMFLSPDVYVCVRKFVCVCMCACAHSGFTAGFKNDLQSCKNIFKFLKRKKWTLYLKQTNLRLSIKVEEYSMRNDDIHRFRDTSVSNV